MSFLLRNGSINLKTYKKNPPINGNYRNAHTNVPEQVFF